MQSQKLEVNETHRKALFLPFIEMLRACEVTETEIHRIFTHPKAQISSDYLNVLFENMNKARCFKPILHPCTALPTVDHCHTPPKEEVSRNLLIVKESSPPASQEKCESMLVETKKDMIHECSASHESTQNSDRYTETNQELTDSEGEFALPPGSQKEIRKRTQKIREALKRTIDMAQKG
ncbi:Ran-binding protein 1 [Perkinsela sp. CCAP 1560/4]|nr:Ran-binding protein 1 [Perkinsela sp. CCAP 1560/4]|eukprot:KNH07605.1 Ran-binding protein 1 [Perkinsela sp. CCAP 1560/4]